MTDGVAKISTLRRCPAFQDLHILMYALAPAKALRLASRIFCLAKISKSRGENV